jgi:RimJ/RimL family protein N-acetyltransferase
MFLFETERLKVRFLTFNDLTAFVDLQSNPDVMKFTGTPAMSAEACEINLKELIEHCYDPSDGFQIWAVEFNSEMIGTCALIQNEKGNELGYRFRKKYWGQGFGSEITAALIEYALITLNQNSVWAEVDVDNKASVKILDRYLNRTEKIWNEQDKCWDYNYLLSKKEYEERRN